MKRKRLLTFGIFILLILLATWDYFSGRKQIDTSRSPVGSIQKNYDYVMKNDPIGQNRSAGTDYYMLALSWSPAFCNAQRKRHGGNLPSAAAYQCDPAQKFGWVIHGLWPQNAQARRIADHPRFCKGDLPMVDERLIVQYLAESPGAELLQGEWEKHGACAFDTARAYFEKQRNLYRTLALPDRELSRTELFRWMKKNNPRLKNVRLHASRNELFICYDLAFDVIDCPYTSNR